MKLSLIKLATSIAVLVLVVLVITLIAMNSPKSTPGVSVIGNNEVRLPAGETFVLRHPVGKTTETWKITYDGDVTVDIRNDRIWPLSETKTGTLCGAGCTDNIDMGWGDHIYVSQLPDGTASVKWPWGGWNMN